MNDISPDTIISRRQNIMAADMSEDLVMMNMDRGMYYGLQSVAAFIWKMLEQPDTIADVCTSVQERFDGVEPDQCQSDVLAFVNDLHAEELIDVHADAA